MWGVTASEDCNKSFVTRGFTAVRFPKPRGQGSGRETGQSSSAPQVKAALPHVCLASAHPQMYSAATGLRCAMSS